MEAGSHRGDRIDEGAKPLDCVLMEEPAGVAPARLDLLRAKSRLRLGVMVGGVIGAATAAALVTWALMSPDSPPSRQLDTRASRP